MRVEQQEFALGRAELATRAPHPELRGLVGDYWGYAEQMTAPIRRRELPSGDVVAILSLGPSMRVDGETHTSFVAGLTEESVVTEMDGVSNGLQLNLTPLGAYTLLGVPMHTLANRSVPLDALLGDELVQRLGDACSWAQRFDVLDVALRARLADARRPAPAVAFAWQRLVASAGRVSVASLADSVGWSRKHLATQFREQVGIAPKAAARILRFQRAVRLIDRGREWGELALECGYYDQAHFNRDFRRFAGSTPTAFVARRLADGLGLAPE